MWTRLDQSETERLREIAAGIRKVRPCAGCTRPCACSGGTHCGCRCTWACERAGERLAAGTTVDKTLLPLAFELASLGQVVLVGTSPSAELRPPSVVFQTDEGFPIRLVERALRRLFATGLTNAEWTVSSEPLALSGGRRFRCQPNPNFCHGAVNFQREARTLANHLFQGVVQEARAELARVAVF